MKSNVTPMPIPGHAGRPGHGDPEGVPAVPLAGAETQGEAPDAVQRHHRDPHPGRDRHHRHPSRQGAGRRDEPLPGVSLGDLDRLRRRDGRRLRGRRVHPDLRRAHPEGQEVRADRAGDRAERVSGVRLLQRRPPARPGTPLERGQPHHRERVRVRVGALPGRLALPPVHPLPVRRGLPRDRRVAAMGQGAADHPEDDHRHRSSWA